MSNKNNAAAVMLQENEDRYRILIEGVSDYAIFMLNPEGIISTWNTGAQRIKGYTSDEIIGKHFSIFYSQEAIDREFPQYELRQAVKHGRFEDEGWRYKKDGSRFWANVVITAIYNKGEHIGFTKITRDLTDRKSLEEKLQKANEELRESEERYRLLIEGVHDYAIFMLSPEGYVSTWNKGAERIQGYKADEIIGKHFSTFYPQEAVERRFPEYELRRAIANGRFEDEGWRIRNDGTSIWTNVVITPIYNHEKELIGFSKVTRDMSDKRRNEQLMHKNKELLRINTDLDNFVYAASHDLKAPIANLEGLVNVLKEDLSETNQDYDAILSRIESSLTRLKNVVTDLTEVTKMQVEHPETEPVNIKDLLEEVLQGLADQIEKSDAEIVNDVCSRTIGTYSRKNLRSILQNLVSNAVKYSSPDRKPVIRIGTEAEGENRLLLTVSDNGLGLEDYQKSKIFSMFKRMHTHVEGSGLGLYLVKRILENAGDSIEVESELGQGTTFKVYFSLNPEKNL